MTAPTKNIEAAAQAALDAHLQTSFANLYDKLTMPVNLLKANVAYGYKGVNTNIVRVAFLFERYQAFTSLLRATEITRKTRKP